MTPLRTFPTPEASIPGRDRRAASNVETEGLLEVVLFSATGLTMSLFPMKSGIFGWLDVLQAIGP